MKGTRGEIRCFWCLWRKPEGTALPKLRGQIRENKDLLFIPICPISEKSSYLFLRRTVLLKNAAAQRSTLMRTLNVQTSLLNLALILSTDQSNIWFKTPLHLRSGREMTVLISTFLFCLALWGWHLKYPGFYWKQIYYSRTERTEMVITALSWATFIITACF